jgi:rhamnopyranosyl-N-acetylglucosaminyl-diphospho-decaprenol beta-1,3/1,4-galactofuranosyltransferase
MIVTYNRKALLRECLLSLEAQTRPVDEIFVINNASTDGTQELLREEFPHWQTLHLPTNTGASRGYYEGIKYAYEQGFDWVWVVDDEGRAAPDCLEKLLAHGRPNSIVVPLKQDSSGRLYGVHAWRRRNVDITAEVASQKQPVVRDEFLFDFTATLISRQVVHEVGFPNKDFFIWFDDFEYAFRIKNKIKADIIVVPDALFFHDFGANTREVRFLGRRSTRSDQPAWKLYYGARNPLYTLLRSRRKLDELLLFLLVQFRLLLMDVVYEHDRWERVRMRLMGFWDGVVGRLGKRVQV